MAQVLEQTGIEETPLISRNQKSREYRKLIEREKSRFQWDPKNMVVDFDFETKREVEVIPLINKGPFQHITTLVNGRKEDEAISPFVIDPDTKKPKIGDNGMAIQRQTGVTETGSPSYQPAELTFFAGDTYRLRVPENNDVLYALLRDVGNASVEGVPGNDAEGANRYTFYMLDAEQEQAKRREEESRIEAIVDHLENALTLSPEQKRLAAIESIECALGLKPKYGNDKLAMRAREIRAYVEKAPEQYAERVMSRKYPYYAVFNAGLWADNVIVRVNEEYVYYGETKADQTVLGVTQEESVDELSKASLAVVFHEIKQRTGLKLLDELLAEKETSVEQSASKPSFKETVEVEHNGSTYKVVRVGDDYHVYKPDGGLASPKWPQHVSIVNKAKELFE